MRKPMRGDDEVAAPRPDRRSLTMSPCRTGASQSGSLATLTRSFPTWGRPDNRKDGERSMLTQLGPVDTPPPTFTHKPDRASTDSPRRLLDHVPSHHEGVQARPEETVQGLLRPVHDRFV